MEGRAARPSFFCGGTKLAGHARALDLSPAPSFDEATKAFFYELNEAESCHATAPGFLVPHSPTFNADCLLWIISSGCVNWQGLWGRMG